MFIGGSFGIGFRRRLRPVARHRFSRAGIASRPFLASPFRPGIGDRQCVAIARLAGIGSAQQFVFGSDGHKGGTEKCVGASGVNIEGVERAAAGNLEANRRAFRAPNPVGLHCADFLRPVDGLQIIEEPIRIGGNPHHPLA